VDLVNIEKYEEGLKNNLYKLWNRMSSGSYFPLPVRRVEIPKGDGKTRPLGIPTVEDRIAQQVVKAELEAILEPHFHPDSYGYRPGKSAIQAVATARKRCHEHIWAVDVDIQGFFDTIDHALLLKAVKHHVKHPWMLLYIERWLTAPVRHPDGRLEERSQGTPQGGVISPLLANLFLHYVMDRWVTQHYPEVQFERYADDVVFHCKTQGKARRLLAALRQRMEKCKLNLHPEKTKIVFCKDSNRWREEEQKVICFDFLGYTFKPRLAKNSRGQIFTAFTPEMSRKSMKGIMDSIRSLKLNRRGSATEQQIAELLNPKIRGWINYFQHFGKARVYALAKRLDTVILSWARHKYKRLKHSYRKNHAFLARLRTQQPRLFAHWYMLKQDWI
jgi:RNA-directed DNA polymerase